MSTYKCLQEALSLRHLTRVTWCVLYQNRKIYQFGSIRHQNYENTCMCLRQAHLKIWSERSLVSLLLYCAYIFQIPLCAHNLQDLANDSPTKGKTWTRVSLTAMCILNHFSLWYLRRSVPTLRIHTLKARSYLQIPRLIDGFFSYLIVKYAAKEALQVSYFKLQFIN